MCFLNFGVHSAVNAESRSIFAWGSHFGHHLQICNCSRSLPTSALNDDLKDDAMLMAFQTSAAQANVAFGLSHPSKVRGHVGDYGRACPTNVSGVGCRPEVHKSDPTVGRDLAEIGLANDPVRRRRLGRCHRMADDTVAKWPTVRRPLLPLSIGEFGLADPERLVLSASAPACWRSLLWTAWSLSGKSCRYMDGSTLAISARRSSELALVVAPSLTTMFSVVILIAFWPVLNWCLLLLYL